MAYNAEILFGRITKINGFEGAVTVKLEKIFIENIPDMESVFLEIEGRPVPFFIKSLDYNGGDIARLQFADYESDTKAAGFVGCMVFLTSYSENNSGDDKVSLTGYTVFSGKDNRLGRIAELTSVSGQWLLTVKSETGKEYLIPLHEDFIIKIDKKKKIIFMELPEGLTEIN
jgi:16S rRNA processing protein RimM